MRACFRCGSQVRIEGKVGFRETCPNCDWDLHVCRNCRFWDREASNECREPQAEPVGDKERSNYCEYFDYREGRVAGEDEALAKARERAKKLFPF